MKPSSYKSFLINTAMPHFENVLTVGQPGVGKSAIHEQAAAELGWQYIKATPCASDPTDFKGMPCVINGKAAFVPFDDLEKMIATASAPLIVDFEDIGQAPGLVQAAIMHLIHAREVAGHRIGQGVRFVASTNRRKDKAGVSGLIEPLKNRFAAIINLDFDLNDWSAWALSNGVPVEVVSYFRMCPQEFDDWKPSNDIVNTCTPRSAAAAGRLIAAGLSANDEHEVIEGAIGAKAAAGLVGFLKVWRSQPNPDGILTNPGSAPVPTDSATLFALVGMLTHRATDRSIDAVLTYGRRMPEDVRMALDKMLDIKATASAAKAGPDFRQSQAWINWQIGNQRTTM